MQSAAMTLILVNVGIFIVNALFAVFGYPNLFSVFFGLWPDSLQHGFLWTPITYGFLHANLLHLFVNMLGLYFLGPPVEMMLGRKRFLQLYFACILGGALLYLLFHFGSSQSAAVIGASAAVIGLLIYFCLARPDQPITLLLFFILPVTLKPKWILWGFLALDGVGLIFSELPARFGGNPAWVDGISHSAHLGGILAAFLFWRFMPTPWGEPRRSSGMSVPMPDWMKRRHQAQNKRQTPVRYSVNISKRKNEPPPSAEEIDRILDKISEEGFASLTQAERQALERHRSRKKS